jgi:hypothetical protein
MLTAAPLAPLVITSVQVAPQAAAATPRRGFDATKSSRLLALAAVPDDKDDVEADDSEALPAGWARFLDEEGDVRGAAFLLLPCSLEMLILDVTTVAAAAVVVVVVVVLDALVVAAVSDVVVVVVVVVAAAAPLMLHLLTRSDGCIRPSQPYFVNDATGESSWIHPSKIGKDSDLPPGWEEHKDEEGDVRFRTIYADTHSSLC